VPSTYHLWKASWFCPNKVYLEGFLLNILKTRQLGQVPQGSPSHWPAVPPATGAPSSPSFRSWSQSSQAKLSKRNFLSERFQAEVPKRKSRYESVQAKISKLKFPSESYQAKVPKRTIPYESSQAEDSKLKAIKRKLPKRKLPIESSQTKVLSESIKAKDAKRPFLSDQRF
jgi:hypothetical protein